MRGALERNITFSVLKYLRSIPGCRVQKRHGGILQAGDPDITGCYRGTHLELEVKRPGEKPTARQEAQLAKWRAAGAIVAVVHSVAETRELIDRHFSEREELP